MAENPKKQILSRPAAFAAAAAILAAAALLLYLFLPRFRQTPENAHTCVLSISCATILDRMEDCAPEKRDLVPEDGWILAPAEVPFAEGDTAFDVLKDECRRRGIHMEFSLTPAYGTAYVEGIGNIYEMDAGSLSGWTYMVNGEFFNYSASEYPLADGDEVAWLYTCDLGADVGNNWQESNSQ